MNRTSEVLSELINQQFDGVSLISFLLVAIIGVAAVYALIVLYERMCGKKVEVSKKIGLYLLVIYLDFLLQMTYFRRPPGSRTGMVTSLKEFIFCQQSAEQMLYQFLNIVLFFPFGAILTVLWKELRGWRRMTVIIGVSYLCSLIIEFTQLLTQRGYFEVTDLLMNVLGGAFGCLFMSVLIKIRKQ